MIKTSQLYSKRVLVVVAATAMAFGIALGLGAMLTGQGEAEQRLGAVDQSATASDGVITIEALRAEFGGTSVEVELRFSAPESERRPVGIAPNAAELNGVPGVSGRVRGNGTTTISFPSHAWPADATELTLTISSVQFIDERADIELVPGDWRLTIEVPESDEADQARTVDMLDPAVVQIAGLALTSGNAVLLKGGSEALHSNRALSALIQQVLQRHGLDPACVDLLEDRAAFAALLACHQDVDLIIARGSGPFVQHVMDSTKIPVLGHAEGLCHVYLHADADPQQAAAIIVDAKCSYPSACNATEALLVHRDFLPHLAEVGAALAAAGVALRADPACLNQLEGAQPAGPDDLGREYGDLVLAVYAVDDLEAAVEHIHRHGSAHTEAICTADPEAGRRFLAAVDAASVFVNASTRFADGYRYGLGAEVGISTGKLHARGPVGVEGLVTYRWLLRGHGEVASDYGPGKRAFRHRTRKKG